MRQVKGACARLLIKHELWQYKWLRGEGERVPWQLKQAEYAALTDQLDREREHGSDECRGTTHQRCQGQDADNNVLLLSSWAQTSGFISEKSKSEKSKSENSKS